MHSLKHYRFVPSAKKRKRTIDSPYGLTNSTGSAWFLVDHILIVHHSDARSYEA